MRYPWGGKLAVILSVVIVFGLASLQPGTERTRADEGKQGSVAEANDSQGPRPEVVYSVYVDENGKISRPTDYRSGWAHLGTFAAAKKKGQDVKTLHGVYTQSWVVDAFNRSGEFPDGAVLVKEVRKAESGKMTTGHVAWSTEMDVWFVMIKDRKERFPESSHWGDGWGWALFKADNPTENVSKSYQISCIGCHLPAEEDDWIYLRGYPTLKKPEKE